jgi:hypothetical protein
MLVATLGLLLAALLVTGRMQVSAQVVKMLTAEPRTTRAAVETVDVPAGRLTLREPNGEIRLLHVPPDVLRLEGLRPGQTVRATWHDNIVVRVKPPGEPDADARTRPDPSATGLRPVGTFGSQQTITATVAEIDLNAPAITFTGAHDWTFRTRVQNRHALRAVKVGDRVDLTWMEGTLVSLKASHR